MSACLDFDWIIVNDDFEHARQQLMAIIRAWPLRRARQEILQKARLAELLD